MMAENTLELKTTEQAKIAISSLSPDDRRVIEAWLDHLRNWRNDPVIRERSRRLPSDEDIYLFQTTSDLVIAFRVAEDDVTVLSIFRKEALRPFEKMAGQVVG